MTDDLPVSNVVQVALQCFCATTTNNHREVGLTFYMNENVGKYSLNSQLKGNCLVERDFSIEFY